MEKDDNIYFEDEILKIINGEKTKQSLKEWNDLWPKIKYFLNRDFSVSKDNVMISSDILYHCIIHELTNDKDFGKIVFRETEEIRKYLHKEIGLIFNSTRSDNISNFKIIDNGSFSTADTKFTDKNQIKENQGSSESQESETENKIDGCYFLSKELDLKKIKKISEFLKKNGINNMESIGIKIFIDKYGKKKIKVNTKKFEEEIRNRIMEKIKCKQNFDDIYKVADELWKIKLETKPKYSTHEGNRKFKHLASKKECSCTKDIFGNDYLKKINHEHTTFFKSYSTVSK